MTEEFDEVWAGGSGKVLGDEDEGLGILRSEWRRAASRERFVRSGDLGDTRPRSGVGPLGQGRWEDSGLTRPREPVKGT